MTEQFDIDTTRAQIAAALDEVALSPAPEREIAQRARSRRSRRRSIAVSAVAAAVAIVAVAVFPTTHRSAHVEPAGPTPTPIDSATPTPTPSDPGFPVSPLATRVTPPPGAPSVFVAEVQNRIALLDTATGKRLRFLTNTVQALHHQAIAVAGAAQGGDSVYFLRDTAGCASEVVRVPLTGGTATRVFHDAQWSADAIAVDPAGTHMALAGEPCHSVSSSEVRLISLVSSTTTALIVDERAAADQNGSLSVSSLAITANRVAIQYVVHNTSLEVTGDLQSLRGRTPLSKLPIVPGTYNDGCSRTFGGGLAWAGATRLVVGTSCYPSSATYLDTIDVSTRRHLTREPLDSDGIGIQSITSDGAGHFLVWLEGGDGVGDILEVGGGGVYRLHTGTCTSIDPQPDPCPRAPAW